MGFTKDTSKTLLALFWGTVATWWVGAGLGVGAAACARVGSWPKLGARQLFKPILLLLAVTGLGSLVAGILGYYLFKQGKIDPRIYWPSLCMLEQNKQYACFANACAHEAAYTIGECGGLVLLGWILYKRFCLNRMKLQGAV
jgi:hypothetical protein